MNKILTLDKMAESSRGAFIYTFLMGKALEAVEHLELLMTTTPHGGRVTYG